MGVGGWTEMATGCTAVRIAAGRRGGGVVSLLISLLLWETEMLGPTVEALLEWVPESACCSSDAKLTAVNAEGCSSNCCLSSDVMRAPLSDFAEEPKSETGLTLSGLGTSTFIWFSTSARDIAFRGGGNELEPMKVLVLPVDACEKRVRRVEGVGDVARTVALRVL